MNSYTGTFSSPKTEKKKKTLRVTLDAFEFIRRFTLHILPPRFMKIRAYSLLANANKKQALAAIRKSLGMQLPPEPEDENETAAEKILRLCTSPRSLTRPQLISSSASAIVQLRERN